jgi:hypothetical protein
MANMELITSVTVGSGGASSVTLPATGSIAATYTDLKVVASVRTEGTGSPYLYLRFNSSSTGYSNRRIIGDGSAASSSAPSDAYIIGGICNTTDQTTNTFSSHDIYIPNYAGSDYKSVSVDAVTENNATSARAIMLASLWSNTSAITSIVFTNEAAVDFAEGSTFYLYGISNVTSSTKATGGIVSSDGTYNYHMFPYSGTFTPTQNITADYLVIAGGGGGGGGDLGGGGGAGGLRSTVGTTGGGGSLESALSLTANTGYTVTVGAGGTGSSSVSVRGTSGSNSVFSTITSTGGGGGGTNNTGIRAGLDGGSGGGGTVVNPPDSTIRGLGTANQGYNGGYGLNYSGQYASGAGGGAGAVGGNGSSTVGGTGGAGVAISAFANATQTGVNTYYAGGGAGSGDNSALAIGGVGGGGTNQAGSNANGIVNTGSGGGGTESTGGTGGSGLVIIRYAI